MVGRRKNQTQRGSRQKPAKSKNPSPLPSRYTFTPANETDSPPANETGSPPETPHRNPTPTVKDYPPPKRLFQSSLSHPPPTQARSTQATATQATARQATATQGRSFPERRPRKMAAQPPASPPRPLSPPIETQPPASLPRSSQHSRAPATQPSSPAHSGEEVEGVGNPQASLAPDQMALLHALLMKPGREEYTTVLSPIPKPNTTWFGRDKSSLTRKITRIFTNKFNGPYYSWTWVPRERQERYFVEFAKTHTWDLLITGVVQEHFESICQRRMKDMISTARTSRVQPKWIGKTIWDEMTAYWDTDEAKEKSTTTSDARMSDRGGLGPHVHLSGQKSYLQIQQEMEKELGRPVSLGEVFIKTHTKPDGTFVDQKAKTVAQRYSENLESTIANLEAENSETSGAASRRLTVDEENEIFLKSTFSNEKGAFYGVGSLKRHVNGKRKYSEGSYSFSSLQQQLEEAKQQIEAQASANSAREEELRRVTASQQAKIDQLSLVEKYLSETDPRFMDYIAANKAPIQTGADPQTSSAAATDHLTSGGADH